MGEGEGGRAQRRGMWLTRPQPKGDVEGCDGCPGRSGSSAGVQPIDTTKPIRTHQRDLARDDASEELLRILFAERQVPEGSRGGREGETWRQRTADEVKVEEDQYSTGAMRVEATRNCTGAVRTEQSTCLSCDEAAELTSTLRTRRGESTR